MMLARVKLCKLRHGFKQHIYGKSLYLLQLKAFWCLLDYLHSNNCLEKLKLMKYPSKLKFLSLLSLVCHGFLIKGTENVCKGTASMFWYSFNKLKGFWVQNFFLSLSVTLISYVPQYLVLWHPRELDYAHYIMDLRYPYLA